ncbi:hypothetical protein [Thalassospira lucentensis]|uniref:hypothetical protein n=1 Tax=Thalassospira lucentensis TaxID=168935 RepID=UPI00142D92DF|nr:hypothetical protein [Thalassospira lucentensis]NIZ03447.1 hypothetical protein [Thalassospira lucentensis]
MKWLEDGQKFAVIGLDLAQEDDCQVHCFGSELLALGPEEFEMDELWRQWIGSIRTEDIQEFGLLLVAKKSSETPKVMDAENQELLSIVGNWMMGLTLARSYWTYRSGYQATGSKVNGQLDVRTFGEIASPARAIVVDDQPITTNQLKTAASIGENLGKFVRAWKNEDCRLRRCLAIYQSARNSNDILDRIHQFVRCVEGLILPEQGQTKQRFKGKTELFIGPKHHSLMDKLYTVRSAVEHMNDHTLLGAADRESRLEIAKLESSIEYIARTALSRIILSPQLAEYFSDIETLEKFWALDLGDRKELWGEVVNPSDAFAYFDFDRVTNNDLGL